MSPWVPIVTLIAAIIAAIVAGITAYFQRKGSKELAAREETKELHERYKIAVDHMGDDNPAVRIAGVYELVRLAEDWESQRQSCIDVLCAYIRTPITTVKSELTFDGGDIQVRKTVFNLIAAHLSEKGNSTWRDYKFDFSEAEIVNIHWRDLVFGRTVIFTKAKFYGECSVFNCLFDPFLNLHESVIHGKLSLLENRFSSGQAEVSDSKIESSGRLQILCREDAQNGALWLDGLDVLGQCIIGVPPSKYPVKISAAGVTVRKGSLMLVNTADKELTASNVGEYAVPPMEFSDWRIEEGGDDHIDEAIMELWKPAWSPVYITDGSTSLP